MYFFDECRAGALHNPAALKGTSVLISGNSKTSHFRCTAKVLFPKQSFQSGKCQPVGWICCCATSADNEPQKKSGIGVFYYEHVYLLLAHDIEHWRLTDAVGPACLLLSPWQRAPVHADGRCDGEGGLERGRLRVRLHRWLLALPPARRPGPPAGRPQKIPRGHQETGRLCE